MKKIIVLQDFNYHDEDYKVGAVIELVDHVADKLCNRHWAKEYCEEEKDEYTPEPKKKKRKSRRKKKE